MSVINQMLRDLDQRGQEVNAAGTAAGTRSVVPPPIAPRRTRRRYGATAALLGLLTLVAVVGAWYGDVLQAVGLPAQVPAAPPPSPAVAMPAPAAEPASAALPSAEVTPQVQAPILEAGPSVAPLPGAPVALRLDAELEHLPRAAAVQRPAPVTTTVAPARTGVNLPSERAATVQASPSTAAPPAAATGAERVATSSASPQSSHASAAADSGSGPQRQLAAARDALAQAQGLWAQGQQTSAHDLLRDALPLAERNAAVAGMDAVVVVMVRELARMQLALGHVQEAHELLVQHESRTRQVPEVWALRANAAQRLGQHADSVHAYMQALQSRPTEQRWLLGLAVSLAAMGQTQAANEVTERARNEGPIARDIANYLRQMGVVVR